MWQASLKDVQVMLSLESYIHECGFDERRIHLLEARASRINGCAYCFDMPTKDARANGEPSTL